MNKLFSVVALCLLSTATFADVTATQKTEQYFNSIQNNPPALQLFLQTMPKGGDLHNHLDGATYAENLIKYGAAEGFCVDTQTFAAKISQQCPMNDRLQNISADSNLYNAVVYAWSMKGFNNFSSTALDHFFDTFLKFEPVVPANASNIIAEIANRAGTEHENYLELMVATFELNMLTPQGLDPSILLGDKIKLSNNFAQMRQDLMTDGMENIATKAINNLNADDAGAQKIMHCGTAEAQIGCGVKIRYQYVAFRDLPPQEVFAQLLLAFEVANRDPKVLAINLVLPENGPISLRDYDLQMRMIAYLHSVYPKVHISLHAGELTFGQVPPKDLSFHIRDAINIAHAERIGHGVDIAYETNAVQLLKEMAQKQILVEVNLTSNADILGVYGAQHPLPLYLKYGVPVALSTDDEGVLRTDLTNEYYRAELTYHFSYTTLKQFARNSLTYSFLPGASLWQNAAQATPVAACDNDVLGDKDVSTSCQQFLNASEKAQQQWQLESAFKQFEAQYNN